MVDELLEAAAVDVLLEALDAVVAAAVVVAEFEVATGEEDEVDEVELLCRADEPVEEEEEEEEVFAFAEGAADVDAVDDVDDADGDPAVDGEAVDEDSWLLAPDELAADAAAEFGVVVVTVTWFVAELTVI